MLNLPIMIDVAEYLYSKFVVHRKKLTRNLRLVQRTGLLIKEACLQSLVYYFCREFAELVTAGGHSAPLAPFAIHYWLVLVPMYLKVFSQQLINLT